VKAWAAANYAEPMTSMQQSLRVAYVVFAFCAAFFLGGIKGTPPSLPVNCCRRPGSRLAMFRSISEPPAALGGGASAPAPCAE